MYASNENEITIEAYNNRVRDYLTNTPAAYQSHHAPLLRWIDHALLQIPAGGRIFEIGSANAREALYMRTKGYEVVCSDASQGFVEHLKKRGEPALLLNVLTDEIPKGYDLFFVNAVFPHFTEQDFIHSVKKIHTALEKGGILAFSVKQGQGDVWITEKFEQRRFIHHWDAEVLLKTLENLGFELIFMEDNIPGDLPTHTWINITVRKH